MSRRMTLTESRSSTMAGGMRAGTDGREVYWFRDTKTSLDRAVRSCRFRMLQMMDGAVRRTMQQC